MVVWDNMRKRSWPRLEKNGTHAGRKTFAIALAATLLACSPWGLTLLGQASKPETISRDNELAFVPSLPSQSPRASPRRQWLAGPWCRIDSP